MIGGVAGGWAASMHGAGRVDASWAGLLIAAGALLSAALLGAFSLLGQWRSRLNDRATTSERAEAREWPLRALIDEAVSGTLVGVFDSVLLMVVTLLAVIVPDRLGFVFIGVIIALGIHMCLLFLHLIGALYSAYTQSESVPEALDGHF